MFYENGKEYIIGFIMILSTAILSTVTLFFIPNIYVKMSQNVYIGLICVSIFSTSIGFMLQIYWQPRTSATTAAVIYTMEPVFAFLFSILFISEMLTHQGIIGAIIIICAMLITELHWFDKKPTQF